MIKVEAGKYVLYSKDGSKKLGEFDSEQAARDREAEIGRIEHIKEAIGTGAEISLDDKACLVRQAYYDLNSASVPPVESYVIEVFDDYAIVSQGGKYFQVPYTIDDAGAVSFGTAMEVKLQYVSINEALEMVGEPKGKEWEVRVIREGISANKFIYTRHALEQLLPLLEGCPVFAYEKSPGYYGHAPAGKEAGKEKIGCLASPSGVETDGMYEVRAILRVKEGWTAKLKSLIKKVGTGLSIDGDGEGFRKAGIAWVKRFLKMNGVDLATYPSAEGAFLRATEEAAEGEFMDRQQMLTLLKAKRPKIAEKLGEDCTALQLQEALERALAEEPAGEDQSISMKEAQELRGLIEQIKKDNAAAYLTLKLTESKLPGPVKEKIEKKFAGKLFLREELDAELTAEKETLDKLIKSGHVIDTGETRIEVLQEAQDKIQMALDRTFGLEVADKTIKPFMGLREAYVQITGDSEVRGKLPAHKMRLQETIAAADFPNLLGTSMNRRLLKDYAEVDYGESRIISPPFLALGNFKTYEGERVGYFGDLSTVDPETADYVEVAKPGEEKVSGAAVQKGNLLTITRKTILGDDLRGIVKRAQSWGRAARRTFARLVWNLFINNSTYTGDSTAWFTVGHGNLRTTALAAAELSTIVDLIAKFTELNSGERLGLSEAAMMKLLLVVPQELRKTAYQINNAQYLDANFTPNDLYKIFGENNERIFVNPLMTDTNDFGVFRDPNDVDIVVVGFINGQQEPEIFIADQPTVGQMFVADKLQYKIRHEYMAYIGDTKGAHKNQVA